MTIVIAHADADKGAAQSLAKFLRAQSLPVRMAPASRLGPAIKQAESVILVWSRDMARYFRHAGARLENAIGSMSRAILVDIDGAAIPFTGVNASVINARAAGLREVRSWRAVSAAAKGQAEVVEDLPSTIELNGAPVLGEAMADAIVEGDSVKRYPTQFAISYIALGGIILLLLGLFALFFPQISETLSQ